MKECSALKLRLSLVLAVITFFVVLLAVFSSDTSDPSQRRICG